MTTDGTVPGVQQGTYSRLTAVTLRPRYEHQGAGMRVGVVGLTSLAEEALVNWFRVRGISPQVLSERFGREFSIVDSSSLCAGRVSLDHEVIASAVPVGVRHFNVRLVVRDGDQEHAPLRARVTAVLVRRPGRFEEPPEEVSGMLVDALDEVRAAVPGHDPDFEASDLARRMADGTLGWHRSWRVRMESCHHAGRMQHAAHVRALAELAEAFAEDHGLPAGRLLAERGLVSVMPRLRVRLLGDAYAGELLHTRFEVHQAIGRHLFDCRLDSHVERDGRLVPVAFAILLQGFTRADDPSGEAVELDAETIERMTADRTALTR